VLKEEGVDLINRIGLSDEEKDQVYYRNAKQFLKL
jgi:predicted TIM-barrel fold metal-dependent hydrolase